MSVSRDLKQLLDDSRAGVYGGDPLFHELMAWSRQAYKALREARQYVKQANVEAEVKHDNPGEFYLDFHQYEIIQVTEALERRIDALTEIDPKRGLFVDPISGALRATD